MKAISIKQPMVDRLFWDDDNVVFRSEDTEYRGELLICSSAKRKVEDCICGYALYVMDLIDVIAVTSENFSEWHLCEPPDHDNTVYAWVLDNLRLVDPFPAIEAPGVYDVDDGLIHMCSEIEQMGDDEVQAWFDTWESTHWRPLVHKRQRRRG